MYNVDIENYPEKEIVDMSIVTMQICTDGICCITDSRVLDEDKQVVSDEIFKSTVIKNVNGYNLLVGVAGAGMIDDKEVIEILNKRFDNATIKVEFGIENLLYTICSYLQTIKTDNLGTSVVFGYYENGQPHIALFEITRLGLTSLFTKTKYAVVGESRARDEMSNMISKFESQTFNEFASKCVALTQDIIHKYRNETNYGVGGYVNVIAIDENGVINISI